MEGVTSHLNLVNTANLSNTEWVDFAIYAKNNNIPTMEITLRITGGSGDNGKTLLLDDMVVHPAIEAWREQFSGGFTAVHLNRVVNGCVRNLETIDNHVSVVSSAAKHLTISDITIRNETNRAVHNLINSRVESADNLIENIRFLVPAAAHGGMRGHMGLLTEWFTSGNVHKNKTIPFRVGQRGATVSHRTQSAESQKKTRARQRARVGENRLRNRLRFSGVVAKR